MPVNSAPTASRRTFIPTRGAKIHDATLAEAWLATLRARVSQPTPPTALHTSDRPESRAA